MLITTLPSWEEFEEELPELSSRPSSSQSPTGKLSTTGPFLLLSRPSGELSSPSILDHLASEQQESLSIFRTRAQSKLKLTSSTSFLLTPSLSSLSPLSRAVFVIVPFMIINAEKAGREFQHAQWTGIGLEEMNREEKLKEQAWEGLSVWDQRKAWAK